MKVRLTRILFAILLLAFVIGSSNIPVSFAADSDPYLSLELQYSDNSKSTVKSYEEGTRFVGYFYLRNHFYTEDVEDINLVWSVPAEYVKEGSIKLSAVASESETVVESIGSPYLDTDNTWKINIKVSNFDRTHDLMFRFEFETLMHTVPSDYEFDVNVTGTYPSSSDSTQTVDIAETEALHYRPLYEDYDLVKYLNRNISKNNAVDNLDVVVKSEDDSNGGATVTSGLVTYAFKIDTTYYTESGTNFRAIEELTLIDTIPSGAKLAEGYNEGWTEVTGENGEVKVQKTFVADSSVEAGEDPTLNILNQLNNEKLVLDVTGMSLDAVTSEFNYYTKTIENYVSFEGIPFNRGKNEAIVTDDDTLLTRLTTRISAEGSVYKKVMTSTIYDEKSNRETEIEWLMDGSNKTTTPLSKIVLRDNLNEKTGCKGLDSRLRFTRIKSDMDRSALPDGKTSYDLVKEVVVYYDDDTTETYSPKDLTYDGTNFELVFDSDKVVVGFEVVLDEDYQMEMGEVVALRAYTVFKDVDSDHYDSENDSNNDYFNYFQMESVSESHNDEGKLETTTHWATVNDKFKLLAYDEFIEVSKRTYYNNPTTNSNPGDSYAYMIGLSGSLNSAKTYENLRVVDLLPEGISPRESNLIVYNAKLIKTDEIEIIENYKDTGRTAVIFPFDADVIMEEWAGRSDRTAYFTFYVTIDEDTPYGMLTNDVYVVGDNLSDYTGSKGEVDALDIDNDGNTKDQITHAYSDSYVTGGVSIYANKYIAPAGTTDWVKTGFIAKAGEDYDYLLRVNNESGAKKNLVVYDVLPTVGDQNIFQSGARNSEFTVKLREGLTVPDGYTAYYTTSKLVYSETMETMISDESDSLWSTTVDDYSEVTAIKVVADEDTTIAANSKVDIIVPVTMPSSLTDEQKSDLKLLLEENSGETPYLTAINNFGYMVDGFDNPKQANDVYLKITDDSITKTSISVTKKWDDENNQDGLRPESIKVILLADGVQVDSRTVSEDDDWTTTFSDLQEYVDGKKVVYTVDEVSVDNYDKDITGDVSKGFTITNTHVPETVEVAGAKTWDDKDNADGIRPKSITINLYADDVLKDNVTVSEKTDWSYSWTRLPKYKNGKEIVYTITEDEVSGYTATYDGYNITNTHTTEKSDTDSSTDGNKTTTKNSTSNDTPKTDDNSNILLWMIICLASLVVGAMTAKASRKKDR